MTTERETESMKFERAHIWEKGDHLEAHATVDVPGIGKVEFHSALSADLCNRIRDEVIAALRVKFGQRLAEKLKAEEV